MRRFRALALPLSVLAIALLLAAGPGTRSGVWDFRTGFQLLRWSAYLGIAGAGLGLLALLWRTVGASLGRPLAAIVLGVLAAAVPWRWQEQAKRVPPIHDITTDTEHPPEFVEVLRLRADAPNPATYEGAAIAAQQRAAYPDIVPLMVPQPPAETFRRALATAAASGWEVVALDSTAGRIEATATTPWFGFKDDVVVRIKPDGRGSRVDVRSVSRVGKSDVGANAERIRDFLERLR